MNLQTPNFRSQILLIAFLLVNVLFTAILPPQKFFEFLGTPFTLLSPQEFFETITTKNLCFLGSPDLGSPNFWDMSIARFFGVQEWSGVDESVVERFAKEHGREAKEPLINTDQGDLLLFVFLIAGAIGGFFAGYYWRMFISAEERKSKSAEGNLVRKCGTSEDGSIL